VTLASELSIVERIGVPTVLLRSVDLVVIPIFFEDLYVK
jgi:hypothetical protein